MTGHLLGGAGGLEAGITVLALRDQILPPTINLENPDPDTAGMDLVPNQARKAQTRIRHVEFVRFWRDEWGAAVPALERVDAASDPGPQTSRPEGDLDPSLKFEA